MSDINCGFEKVLGKWEGINFTAASGANSEYHKIEKKEVSDFKNEGFLLAGLLSKEECTQLISEGELLGFTPIEGATPDYRTTTRIMVESDELASLLWERIQPYLSDIEITGDPHDVHIHGVESLLKGRWQPLKLNNHFRLCKYEPGGHFAPHYDGFFTETSQVRSLISVVIYLNEDFDKGRTNFLQETQTHNLDEDGKQCAADKDILYSVKPESGNGLLFHHHRLHEGEAVKNGVKYILRTDIMFKHVDSKALDPIEEQALQIAQEAERFECCGQQKKAVKLFNKAFEILPILADSYKT